MAYNFRKLKDIVCLIQIKEILKKVKAAEPIGWASHHRNFIRTVPYHFICCKSNKPTAIENRVKWHSSIDWLKAHDGSENLNNINIK